MKMLELEYHDDVKRRWKTKYCQKDCLASLSSLFLKARHADLV